ncbi:MAG: hypothetical protein HC866_04615 [Leptolyngbyaceae cyanobacterium RU_5_1]|nr:hypothetical protein [Leptolyngbyaceae cyanobacterium RU_5_1]
MAHLFLPSPFAFHPLPFFGVWQLLKPTVVDYQVRPITCDRQTENDSFDGL